MSEANNNSTAFSSESNNEFITNDLRQQDNSCEAKTSNSLNSNHTESKMNWQKVAHKLREYNRKLLKQVFRLEQELAEVNNKFDKYTEKSQNSDLLVVQQESELQNYQQQIAVLTQHLTASQKEIEQKESTIEELSQQYELSQQETARLERDCTLLQEKYSQNSYDLTIKEKENKELQEKLNKQKRYTLQYQAELKRDYPSRTLSPKDLLGNRDRDKPTIPHKTASSREPIANTARQYSTARSIQPWSELCAMRARPTPLTSSNTTNLQPKIALPKTKASAIDTKRTTAKTSDTVKTAAEIATWSASQVQSKRKATANNNNKSKSTSGKPQSLAAVDLPTFPRPL